MTKMTLKTIEMIRRIRDEHYEQVKDKSHTERIAFYRAKARSFRQQVSQSLQEQQQAETKPA
jgi:hypothetical protein